MGLLAFGGILIGALFLAVIVSVSLYAAGVFKGPVGGGRGGGREAMGCNSCPSQNL